MSSYLKGIAAAINGVENLEMMIDIDKIIPSPKNFFEIRDVEELAESIKNHGLMHNLVLRKLENGFYELISGERRLTALKYLNKSQARCIVCNVNELEAELMLIHGNTEQRELTPSEKMESIRRLKDIYDQKRENGEELPKGKKTRDLIGEDMHMSGTQVGRYQKIDKGLIKPLVEKLNTDDMTVTQAHTLSSLSKEEQQIIHEEIKDLDPKECKEEIEILIQGIKQPINKKDKGILDEMYPNLRSKGVMFEEFENMIKYDSTPKLIILSSAKAVLNTQRVRIVNGTLSVELTGNNPINAFMIEFKTFDKVGEIMLDKDRCLTLEHGYKINECTYLWFENGGI